MNGTKPDVKTTGSSRPRVYFARGVDGLEWSAVLQCASLFRARLSGYSIELIDPVAEGRKMGVRTYKEIVETDLDHLRSCNAVLMDMSIPNRNYIGCCCELVYASLWHIPSVVYVGQSGNGERPWLRYHASAVCKTQGQAVIEIVQLIQHSLGNEQ